MLAVRFLLFQLYRMGKNTIPPLGCFLWLAVCILSIATNAWIAEAGLNRYLAVMSCEIACFAFCSFFLRLSWWCEDQDKPTFQPPSHSQTSPSSEPTPTQPAAAETTSEKITTDGSPVDRLNDYFDQLVVIVEGLNVLAPPLVDPADKQTFVGFMEITVKTVQAARTIMNRAPNPEAVK